VPGLPNVAVKPLAVYLKYVAGLETFKGHDDDQRRKKRRKQLLALRDYVEKEFVPRDLTQTSQLVRLGAQALQKHYLGDAQAPVIISLPGSVTGAVRKSWKLAGCLGLANPQIFDEEGEPRTKADIRGITHLHHALDACVLAFASLFLPRDGGAWELLVKRRLSPDEQRRARACFGSHIEISKDGELRLPDLPSQYKEQIRACLAERRVVQHVPADPSGLECKETVWRVFDATDRHHSTRRLGRWLEQAKIAVPASDARTALIVCRKRKSTAETESTGGKVLRETKIWLWVFDIKDKSALLGLEPDGDPAQAKLKKLKAVKVLGDNFGLALDPQPTLIRPHKVWPQLQSLRSANGGKPVRVLRKGILVRVPKRGIRPKYEGVWMVRGVTLNQRAGFLVDMSPSDQIIYRRHPGCLENVSVATLLRCGLEVLRAPLSGVPPLPKQAEGYDVPGISDC
jgi:CRISPR-associated endonuclease Csn1